MQLLGVVFTIALLIVILCICRLLCRYNIQCPRNQLLYIDSVEHNIEPNQQSDLFMVRPLAFILSVFDLVVI